MGLEIKYNLFREQIDKVILLNFYEFYQLLFHVRNEVEVIKIYSGF